VIYIVRTISKPSFIKVGFSNKNPEYRIRKLQTASPLELEVLLIKEGTMQEEKSLHARLFGFEVRGEWFRNCPEVLKILGLPRKPIGQRMEWNRRSYNTFHAKYKNNPQIKI
jgi:hypothetical protein